MYASVGLSKHKSRQIHDVNHLSEEKLVEISAKREEDKVTIVQGVRGPTFVKHVTSILDLARISKPQQTKYLNRIELFEQAYTHSSACEKRNYESLEMLGDSVCNSVIVQYLYSRFPELSAPDGSKVAIVAQLKINYVSSKVFSGFAEALGLAPFISASRYVFDKRYKSLLEDVFEAIMGTIWTIDRDPANLDVIPSIGPQYRIIKHFMDKEKISLNYEDIVNPKTQVKQFLEKQGLSMTCYKADMSKTRDPETNIFTFRCFASLYLDNGAPLTAIGRSREVKEAEQEACRLLMKKLKATTSGRSSPMKDLDGK